MPRYKVCIEYEGTAYSGWQIQPNAPTVEETLEEAASRILRTPVDFIGQGRTDSGVHAEGQVAHFDFQETIERRWFLHAMAGVLPRDISIWEMEQVDDDFHARFDAHFRQYRYQITTRAAPLFRRTATLVPHDLDWSLMEKCADLIEGQHDFRCFCKENEDNPGGTECNVLQSAWQKDEQLLTYRIRANRFVHHMVRRLVGSMLQVAKGKYALADFEDFLFHPEAGRKAHGIASKGLILEKVGY